MPREAQVFGRTFVGFDMPGQTRATAFRQALAVLRRRLPVMLACAVIVPVVAYVVSHRQQPRFAGTASVLTSFKQPATDAGLSSDVVFNRDDAQRFATTQAAIARTPALVQKVLATLGRRETVDAFLERSRVVPQPNTDLLAFTVQDDTPVRARRAAATYGRKFVAFRAQLERTAMRRAIADVRAQLRSLHGRGHAAERRTLRAREQQLRTRAALPAAGTSYLSTAADAPKVAPRTKRDVLLGAALGVLLAIGVALLREAIDTRVRRGREISEALGLPVLGRLPKPSRRARGCSGPVVLQAPDTADAEAVRMVRAGFLLATRDGASRSILVGSALAGEGKTTTTANLAAALAASGRHVIAVDLDLRRPGLGPLLGAHGPGIVDVARGRTGLDEALREVELPKGGAAELAGGRLEVLPAGAEPTEPGDFIGTAAVGEILAVLRERADVVLVDSPPLLQVGDGLQLSTRVDALLVVTRLDRLDRGAMVELRKLLDAVQVPALGIVVTGADAEDHTEPAYGYYLLPDEPWARGEGLRGTVPSPRP
jgi:capsular exopolysaccharide synthesis family protein